MRALRHLLKLVKNPQFHFNMAVFVCSLLLAQASFNVFNISAATIGMMSDGEGATEMTTDLNHLITELPAGWALDSVSWNGDIAYSGSIASGIAAYEASTASTVPLFLVTGNHEAESETDMVAVRNYYAQYPAWNLSQIPNSYASTTNYAYDVGGDTRVIAVNQFTSGTSDRDTVLGSGGAWIHDNVFNWVKNEIKKTNMPHIVIMAHEPAYAYGNHIGDSLDADDTVRDKFVNLLASYGTIPHFVGHTHRSSLTQMEYENDNNRESVLGGGIWEMDTGAFGTKASGGTNDAFPTLGYFKTNSRSFGDYTIKLVQGTGASDWASPTVTTKTYNDLDKHILVNTWTGAGTGTTTNGMYDMRYFVDYTATVQANPNWSTNNSGKWWEPAFDASAAGWTAGELAVGYRTGGTVGWLNTLIDATGGNADEQVYGVFGRVKFQVASTTNISSLSLDLDYDDGVMVWLNGTLVYNGTDALMTPPTTGSSTEYFDKLQTVTNHDATGTTYPVYSSLDISPYKSSLVNGTNTLAFWNVNSTTGSSDLGAAIRLTALTSGSDPVATDRYTLQQGVNGYSGMIDSWINGSSTATNYGATSTVEFDGVNPESKGLLKWDLSTVPATTSINAAHMVFNVSNNSTSADGYKIYRLKRPWTESGVTWATYDGTNAWGTAGAASTTVDYDTTVLGTVGPIPSTGIATTTFNTTGLALIQDWIDGTRTDNYGFLIANASNSSDGIVFTSSEGNTTLRPKLVLVYGTEVAVPASLNQSNYRWRNDDGTEVSATWAAAENTALTNVALGTKKRLRLEVRNSGTIADDAGVYTLQYSTSTVVSTGTWTTVPSYSSCTSTDAICLESSQLIHGADTTDVASGLSNGQTTFIPGDQLETSATSSSIQLGGDEFTEIEYSLKVTANATPGEIYYFRLVKNSALLDVYTVAPAITVAAAPGGISTVTLNYQEGVNGYSGMFDTDIKFSNTTGNYAASTTVLFDGDPDASALLKWPTFPGLTSTTTITAASIVFNITDVSTNTYNLYAVRRAWTEAGATWNKWDAGNNTKNWTTAGAASTVSDRFDTVLGTIAPTTMGTQTLTLNSSGIAVLQDWLTTPANNNGFIIQTYTNTSGAAFSSSEEATTSLRPKLSISYQTSGDAVAPTITDITSSKADGTYTTGEVIDVDVTFSEVVTSTGSVTVNFDTGASCTFTVASSTFGTCNHTVTSGHSSSDLNVSSITGTIKDGSNNTMTNFVPTQNLSANKDIRINPPTQWTAYIDVADQGVSTDRSTGNVLNFGPSDGTSSTTRAYSNGASTGVTISYSAGISEGDGPEAGTTVRTPPLYAQNPSDAFTEFGTIVNTAAIMTVSGAGTSFTVSFGNLDTDKTYKLVAYGTRGQYTNRWCRYTVGGATGFTNTSSAAATKSTVSVTDDSATYQCGGNYTEGYVARWTGLNPTGTTLTLTVTGVANGADAASSSYLSALKLVEEADTTGPTITTASSDSEDGSYLASSIIDIDLTFSEISTATTSLTINFDSGGSCTVSPFTSTTTATCDYTVGANDSSGDLAITSITGNIVDAAGNYMTNRVPSTNIDQNKNIRIGAVPTQYTVYLDAADDQVSAEASLGNTENFGGQDLVAPTLTDYVSGKNLDITVTYSGSDTITEGSGAEDDGGTGRATPLYPVSGTDAYTEFGTTTNMSRLTYGEAGNDVVLTFNNLDSTKTYTLVATGMRGRYNTRWCRYTIGGTVAYSNVSSASTTISATNNTDDSTTFNCGNNYNEGYVAKWTNIDPTGESISLTVTGVQVGVDVADKSYLSAVKLVQQAPVSGLLSLGIVDGTGNAVSTPSVTFTSISLALTPQNTTGILGSSSQKIRVTNGSGNSNWSISLTASSPTSLWSSGGINYYDFNDPTANTVDGADTDAFGGQLTINPTTGVITPQSGCAATGISLGSSAAFNQGVTNSITIAASSASTPTNCYWDITNVSMTQVVPAEQQPGSYSIDMTLDVIAS